MARSSGSGLQIGLGLGGVIILLIILILISLCLRASKLSGNATRFGILVPLACLIVFSATVLVVLGSIVLDHFVGGFQAAGGGYNRASPELQYFQLIVGGHAFAAAWLTFWHVIKNTDLTRHTAAGHASVAVFFALIPSGLAIQAVAVGAGLDAVNMAGAVATWVLNVFLIFLAVILMSSRDHAKLEQTQTPYTAPPGVQMHYYTTAAPVNVQPPSYRAVQV